MQLQKAGGVMKRFGIVALLVGLTVVLTACGSSGGGPAGFSYGGQWSGSIQDSMAGFGAVTVTLTQSGSSLAGTWQANFAAGSNGGSASGTINGNQVILELHPSNVTTCPFRVIANRSGSTLSGNYTAFNCLDTVSGTLNISKN